MQNFVKIGHTRYHFFIFNMTVSALLDFQIFKFSNFWSPIGNIVIQISSKSIKWLLRYHIEHLSKWWPSAILNFKKYNLACSENLPTGLYILTSIISSSLFFIMSKAISVSTGPIFTIFSPNGRYLHEFSWSGPVFPIPQGTLPWQPILWKKWQHSTFVALAFRYGMG